METKIFFGDFAGKKLENLQSKLFSRCDVVRPTTAMARSVLFNVLRHNPNFSDIPFESANVLDLCCGTGVVGMEFQSLGAESVVFVDKNVSVLSYISKNLDRFSRETRGDVCNYKTIPALIPSSVTAFGSHFNFVFFDPPYFDTELILSQMKFLAEDFQNGFVECVILEVDTAFKTDIISKFQSKEIDENDDNIKNKESQCGMKLILERKVNSKTKLLFYR